MGKDSQTDQLTQALRDLLNRLEEGESLPEKKTFALREIVNSTLAGMSAAEDKPKKGAVAAREKKASQMEMVGMGSEEEIRIWCDGSCAPNPGAGGWGTIVEAHGDRLELSGASPKSTNNIMEMTAAIEGLKQTSPGSRVHITTDSQYVKNGITQWIKGWKRRGWRKADGEPVLNKELWQALDVLTAERNVKWAWVRGHTGHPENERCDELANQARKGLR